MSIHKRKRKSGTKYIAVIYTPAGKQITKTFARKVDAERWEIEQKQKLYSSPIRDKETMLVKSNTKLSAFCDEWIREYATHNKTASSLRRDKQIVRNQIVPHLGNLCLNEVTQLLIERWKFALKSKAALSPKTCNNCLTLLNKILGDACRWKYVDVNEAKYVPKFRIQKREPRFWNDDEARRFMDFVLANFPHFYPVFALALYTGLRKGEIRGLKWDCVDLNRRVIVIKRIYCDVEKRIVDRTKGKKDRLVPINEALFRVLIQERFKSEFVVPVFDWLHPHRLMAKLCRKSEVTPIRFHDLRHTFASLLVMRGKPLYEVQKLLGHASYSTTEQYAHLAPGYLTGATDGLNFEVEGPLADVVKLPVST